MVKLFRNLALGVSLALCASVFTHVAGFDLEGSDNVVVYWGQNSAGSQLALREYCDNPGVDVVIISFVYSFVRPQMIPLLNQAASTCFIMENEQLKCPDTSRDIEMCQSKGKKILVSIGGASGSYSLDSPEGATLAADMVWDTYLGGDVDQSQVRPFGDVELDGIDLDLENLGPDQPELWMVFMDRLREIYTTKTGRNGKGDYLITGSPQCPFPDMPLSIALQPKRAWFDMLFVQFYNNICAPTDRANFNFNTWADWARRDSLNPKVKIFLGAPVDSGAASSGWIPKEQLVALAGATMRENDPQPLGKRGDDSTTYNPFGGMSFWDASWAQPDFTTFIKDSLRASYKDVKLTRSGIYVIPQVCGNTPSVENPPAAEVSYTKRTDDIDGTVRNTSGKLFAVRRFFSHSRFHRSK